MFNQTKTYNFEGARWGSCCFQSKPVNWFDSYKKKCVTFHWMLTYMCVSAKIQWWVSGLFKIFNETLLKANFTRCWAGTCKSFLLTSWSLKIMFLLCIFSLDSVLICMLILQVCTSLMVRKYIVLSRSSKQESITSSYNKIAYWYHLSHTVPHLAEVIILKLISFRLIQQLYVIVPRMHCWFHQVWHWPAGAPTESTPTLPAGCSKGNITHN